MEPYRYTPGTIALLVSIPHTGTYVPDAILTRLTDNAKQLPDTDWHVEKLYDFAKEIGAHILAATHSRYVIDLNRPPDGSSLYPGQQTTGLCPTEDFDGEAIYLDPADAPDDAEVVARRDRFWQPYHDQLAAELARLRAQHGAVALWDAHSIRSVLPRFFEGKLPDLNLGTGQGQSVLQLVTAFSAACGKPLPFRIEPRRPGDISACWADPAKAQRELGWQATRDIDAMCADSWRWQSANPNGYEE